MHAIQWFACTLRRDIDAVGNVLSERWSNRQTERQINRLKTLRRAIHRRANNELPCARMLPLHAPIEHRLCGRPMRLLRKPGCLPERIVTDKLGSYAAAKQSVMPRVEL